MPKMKTTFTGLHFELLCRLDKICPNYTSLIGQTVFLNNVLRHQWHQSSEDEEGSDAAPDDDEDEEESDEEDEEQMEIRDRIETNLVNLRRTIYLTIMSSVDFEEAGHKLMKDYMHQKRFLISCDSDI